MSDDEQEPEVDEPEPAQVETHEEYVEAAPKPKAEPPKPKMRAPSIVDHDDGKPEAEVRMEMERKKRLEKAEEEWKEYEEMRKIEREKEEQEIRELREKKETRKIERAEQEKKLNELRSLENEKKRAEEEERQHRKREEELKKNEDRARKGNELTKKPNFIGTGELEQAAEQPQKTKEQLEAEKRAILEQRIQALKIDGFNQSQLTEKAKEFYQRIYHLEGEKYDLEQRFKRQQCDIVELAEKARQMAKGGGKKTSAVTTADTDNVGGIPMQPKVVMYSQYERVKDHRSFGEKQTVFSGPLYKEGYIRIPPEKKVVMTEQGAKIDGAIEEGGSNHDGGHAVSAE